MPSLNDLGEQMRNSPIARPPSIDVLARRSQRRRRRRLAGAMLLPLILLASITGWVALQDDESVTDVGVDPDGSPPSDSDHVLTRFPVSATEEGTDDGIVRGVITVRAGCAILDSVDDGGAAAILWPFGSERVSTDAVSTPGFGIVDVGGERWVEMGGGIGEAARGLRLENAALTECIEHTGAIWVLFASGSMLTTAAPPTTNPPTAETDLAIPTIEAANLVATSRPLTAAEYDRLDDDEGTGILDCEPEGSHQWDYGPIDESHPQGEVAADGLADGIRQVFEGEKGDVSPRLPLEGWIELTDDNDGIVLFLATDADGGWIAVANVGGNAEAGIWRPNSITFCSESG